MSTVIKISDEYESRLEATIASRICTWRNSLFCLAKTVPMMYVALENKILVYHAADLVRDIIEPSECIENPPSVRLNPRRYGAQPGPFDGDSINVLKTFMLGFEEVIVSGDGLGRVIVRRVRALGESPICYNVGRSVWGLDIKNRLLAASANSHDVYLIDMESASAEDDVQCQLKEVLVCQGATTNIPTVTISTDGSDVACVDISGVVRCWKSQSHNKLVVKQIPSMEIDLSNWEMGWSCCYLPTSAFRVISTRGSGIKRLGRPRPNLVRSVSPGLMWWRAVGANVNTDLCHETVERSSHYMLRAFYHAQRGLTPERNFETCWTEEPLEFFTTFVTRSERGLQDLMLIATIDMLLLIHPGYPDQVHAVCHYPFGSRYSVQDDMDRINMLKALPELGIVAVGTQRGDFCVLELIQTTDMLQMSFSFRCHDVRDDSKDRLDGELLGLDLFAIGPGEARLSILYRSGRLKSFRISTKDSLLQPEFSDLVL